MSLSRILMWSLALATLAWAAWAYGSLPERIPVHFGLDGTADRWEDRSLGSWLLPALGLALAALFDAIARWSVQNPQKQTINLPQSADLMALPVERRVPVLRRSAAMLYAVGAVVLVAFALIQVGSYAEAFGRPSQAWVMAGVGVATVGPLAVLVSGTVAVSNEIARQRREAGDAA